MAHHPFDDPKAEELPERANDMNIAVIIPSALRAVPGTNELWLARALRSVAAQTKQPKEVIIGLDPDVLLPVVPSFDPALTRFDVAHGKIPGHQAACNAAARAATTPALAFLEDDDEWFPEHLEQLTAALHRHEVDFVTASQLAVDRDGNRLEEFHFATMSSWLISRLTYQLMGGVDPRFTIHHDNAFLNCFARQHPRPGERSAGREHRRRVHLVPVETNIGHPWLLNVAAFAPVVACLPRFTVRRTVHEDSILAHVGQSPEKAVRSAQEYAAMMVYHGAIGW